MKKITTCILCSILFYPLLLSSTENDDVLRNLLLKSLEIKTDKDRLSSYDIIAKKVKAENILKDKVATSENWVVDITNDPIDDSKKITFSNAAKEKIHLYSTPYLILRYSKGESEAYISWGKILEYSEDNEVEVTLRLDKEEAFSSAWGLSSSRDASFSPEPIDLIKLLFTHKTLIARTEGTSNTLTTQFDLAGLKQLVEKYDNELNWIKPKIEENESSEDGTDDID